MNKRLRELEQKIGYKFRDFSLLERAMMHSSYTNERHLPKYQCNERLEFLGDAVLELYVTEKLYRDCAAREGELTELRKQYVSREALEEAERRLGLLRFLRYAGGADALRGKTASNLFHTFPLFSKISGGWRANAHPSSVIPPAEAGPSQTRTSRPGDLLKNNCTSF